MTGALLGALAAASCVLFLNKPAWFPASISISGRQFDHQLELTLWVIAIIFVCAHLGLVLSIYVRRGPVRFGHGEWVVETLWTSLATVTFLGLAVAGTRIWAGVHPAPVSADAERIEVYAHQFAWNFRYPGADGKFGRTSLEHINDVLQNPFGLDPADPAGKDDIFSATLKVPAGREVVLLLHSRDVIHDFFVRELRFKQDVVPGMEIPYRFRAETLGVFEIACSELCGLGHSQMRATMEVMLPEAYDKWKSSAATTR